MGWFPPTPIVLQCVADRSPKYIDFKGEIARTFCSKTTYLIAGVAKLLPGLQRTDPRVPATASASHSSPVEFKVFLAW
jgi:hypothetical protein